MRTINKRILGIAMVLCGAGFGMGAALAGEPAAPQVRLEVEPFGYAGVDGNTSKFQAHHWIVAEQAEGGVRDFSLEAELPEDMTLEAEGHALISERNFGAEVRLEKEDVWYLGFEYEQFRKYYPQVGGLYYPFANIPFAVTDRDLRLDIGEIKFEAGLKPENFPDIDFEYVHEFKQGTKSRLSWATVTDGGVTRKIAPSWQDIDEDVDKFKVRLSDVFHGFHWSAEQQWETTGITNVREEKNLAIGGTAADRKIRDQITTPQSDLIATILGVNRWFFKEKLYLASNYRYSQVTAQEAENIYETSDTGTILNFGTNAEQVRNAYSSSLYNTHTWVGTAMAELFEGFSVNGKTKAEQIRRRSWSNYPKDKSPNAALGAAPDGFSEEVSVSETEDKLIRFGEGIGFRYSGIPRVALYNEYEFEQVRSSLIEDRQGVSAGEVFSREMITHMYRGGGTLGARLVPVDPVSVTAHVRHREDDVRYNNPRYTSDSTSGAKSVFVDGQYIITDELATRIAYTPCKWFRPSFRYQRQYRNYDTWGLPNSDIEVPSGMDSDTYTLDVTLMPTDEFLVTVAYSIQNAGVYTPAQDNNTNAKTPEFNTDVSMWLVSAEYMLTQELVLTGVFQHSIADNFNDITAYGMPFGADYVDTQATVGVRWNLKKNLWVEPKYSYFRYQPHDQSEYGRYAAHVGYVEVGTDWG